MRKASPADSRNEVYWRSERLIDVYEDKTHSEAPLLKGGEEARRPTRKNTPEMRSCCKKRLMEAYETENHQNVMHAKNNNN